MIKIASSLACADHSRLGETVKELANGGIDLLHFDVMDGHFVENFAMSQLEIVSLRSKTSLPFDVHLAIENPAKYINLFAKAGADSISVHVESCVSLCRLIQKIKKHMVKVSLALNPYTPLSTIQHALSDIDMVLMMTVPPGFRGQSYVPEVLAKIEQLRKIITERQLNIDIQVDGGIYENTIAKMAEAGANIFVVGAAIFDSTVGIRRAIILLRDLATKAYKQKFR
jgi:ribulose-phosphate 3-epimerase